MRIYMQTPPSAEQVPKFYQLALTPDLLQGWMLVKEWGHVGAAGRVKQEHYDDLDSAQQAMEDSRNTQIKKGYHVVFVQGQPKPR